MERILLTDEDRALLRELLTKHIGSSVAFPDGAHDRYSAEHCFRLLQKIEGPGKLVVIESQTGLSTDKVAERAEASGCG
jgi:hypothetical protein